MKTTFDIQELDTLARQFEANMESIRAQAEAQAQAILAQGERQAAEYQRMAEAHRLVIQSLQGTVGAAEAAQTFHEEIQRGAEAASSHLVQVGIATAAAGVGDPASAPHAGITAQMNSLINIAQATSLIDAGRLLIEASAIPAEFDVSVFRDGIESQFQQIAEAITDRSAYSKVLIKLAETGEITIKERGRGRRPSIYTIAEADGGDDM